MKLIIQIPCYNEENTLPATLADLPRRVPGVDVVETQVIDDGSEDATARTAEKLGVTHVVSFPGHRGLAAAFKAGVDNALRLGADVLVNTDGDNQYRGEDIERLVRPVLSGEADVAVGCRPIQDHPEFSPVKKLLQKSGSWVLRKLSRTAVKDAASGFRAYGRNALLRMNVYSEFSYCMETLIQAGYDNLKIVSVDVGVNRKTRESRLFRSTAQYVWRQAKTMAAVFILYRANWFFNFIAGLVLLLATFLAARYVVLITYFHAPAAVFWPSIVLAGVLVVVAFQIFLAGVVASLISSVRKLLEDVNYRVKKLEGPPRD